MTTYTLRITQSRLNVWRQQWPGSTLVVGTVVFDSQGDVVDMYLTKGLTGVDGYELNAFVDRFQSPTLRRVRGRRVAAQN